MIVLIISLFALQSCEDEIMLDLDNDEPRIVIEANISDQAGPYTVLVSRTADYYTPNAINSETGAKVTITGDNGDSETLTETEVGIYKTADLLGKQGVQYTIDVTVQDITYKATVTIPDVKVVIDSIGLEFVEESLFRGEGFYPTVYYNDPPDIENYYQFIPLINGQRFDYERNNLDVESSIDDNYWISDDQFSDGNLSDFDFPFDLMSGDTISVSLYHLDRSTFDYLRTLSGVLAGSSVAPSNPLSNFNNGALGYFGAYTVSDLSTVVE